jgi:hypothetical protein
MSNHFIYGSSSLLFLITTANAFIYSKLFLWKFFNLLLIFASYLCNAYGEYYPKFILFDYITISLLCLSYINQIYINCPYILITIYDKIHLLAFLFGFPQARALLKRYYCN